MKHRITTLRCAAVLACVAGIGPACAQPSAPSTIAYRCPGNLYTDQLTPKQAAEKGCRVLEGQPVTVIQSNRPAAARPAANAGSVVPRIDPNEQRARDGERRSILETEMRREEDRLAELKKEYNNGEPERLGSERNYQKYLDRVAELKAALARKEADIASIKREIGKLPPAQ
jgi:hypothetical protein